MLNHLREYRSFYLVALLFILLGLIGMLTLSKGQITVGINGAHNAVFDFLFKYVTKLGEIWGGILVGLVLILFRPLKFFYIYLIAISISSISAQLLKTQVFSDSNRPSSELYETLHKVDGVDLHENYSFPSGHTTAAFCMFSLLAFSVSRKALHFALALLAVSVAISRMYLGQHYLMDVVAGAVLEAWLQL